jgi:glucose-1-phosphate adenylyltransferase
VLVLSGDHIYKMDYRNMLDFHKEKNADITIAVLEVPIEEASRFGIMNTRDDLSVYEFEEKPRQPKSTKARWASIFSAGKSCAAILPPTRPTNLFKRFWQKYHPAMLGKDERVFAYPFQGYWKDVGTIDSLWEANMDLLNPNLPLNLSDPLWRIYSRHATTRPQYVGDDARIINAMVTEGCEINGLINYSMLFSGVEIAQGANVEYSVLMKNVRIGKNAKVRYAILADDVVIEDGAVVGASPEDYPNVRNGASPSSGRAR